MISSIRTAPTVLLKVIPQHGTEEKLIGYCTAISLSGGGTTKTTYSVDSVFPQEIAYGASPSQISVSMSVFIPKQLTLESLGLIPYRTAGGASSTDSGNSAGDANTIYIGGGDYMHIRLYDRATGDLFYGVDYCKVQQFSISMSARSIIQANIIFAGMYLIPGATTN